MNWRKSTSKSSASPSGIASLGDRKPGFDGNCGEAGGPVALHTSTDAAERRQLTIMFCDLVGSTAMSARLDPEDMRGDTQRLSSLLGDGVLAYFAYPQAHEHDAERARAGLAIVEAAPKLVTAAGSSLHVRVGSRPAWWWGTSSDRGRRRSAASSARRRTSRRAFKRSLNRTRSSSPRAHAGFSAICSSFRTSGQKTSRASPGRLKRGRRCGRVRRKAASRPSPSSRIGAKMSIRRVLNQ